MVGEGSVSTAKPGLSASLEVFVFHSNFPGKLVRQRTSTQLGRGLTSGNDNACDKDHHGEQYRPTGRRLTPGHYEAVIYVSGPQFQAVDGRKSSKGGTSTTEAPGWPEWRAGVMHIRPSGDKAARCRGIHPPLVPHQLRPKKGSQVFILPFSLSSTPHLPC